MSVERYDIKKCIGCRNCVNICPMDVFRFNEDMHKSVIAYPENCQSCGQCFVNCPGHSLALAGDAFGYPITGARAASVQPQNRQLYVPEPRPANT